MKNIIFNNRKSKIVNRPLSIVHCIFFFLFVMQTARAQDANFPTGNGDGTEDNPFQIATAEELAKMAELVNAGNEDYNAAHYILMDNISLRDYQEGEGWTPIGKNANAGAFRGVFDGNEKTISDLKINLIRFDVGLFGRVISATIKNLGVRGEVIVPSGGGSILNSRHGVGGIVGLASGSSPVTTIDNCWFSGSVKTGGAAVGGILGCAGGYTIDAAHTNASLTEAVTAGSAIITNCRSDATIECTSTGWTSTAGSAHMQGLGGIVGSFNGAGGHINNCYFTGMINTPNGEGERVGGIAGQHNASDPGTLSNCFVTGAINGSHKSNSNGIGGIVGFVQSSVDIRYNYFMGTLTTKSGIAPSGSRYYGGIVGGTYSSARIQHNAVLSDKLNGTGIGFRIWGGATNGTPSINNNYVYYAMTNESFADGVTWGEPPNAGANGTDATVEGHLRVDNFYRELFNIQEETPTAWTFEKGKLPGLNGGTVEVPPHLKVNSQMPEIIQHPIGNVVLVGNPYEDLKVIVKPNSGVLTYQWYRSATVDEEGFEMIHGATSAVYYPNTDEKSRDYYYVIITSMGDDKEESIKSNVARVIVVTDATYYRVIVYSEGNGATLPGYYLAESTVFLNAGSRLGYEFMYWSVPSMNVTIDNQYSSETFFEMVAAPVIIEAIFDRLTDTKELPANELKAWINHGVLSVSGLTAGKVWRLYNLSGTLVHQGMVKSDPVTFGLEHPGVYIIESEGNTIKISL